MTANKDLFWSRSGRQYKISFLPFAGSPLVGMHYVGSYD
jgi:hypothetical protein